MYIYEDENLRRFIMKRVFLFLAVALLYCNITLAQEPDPDPNLLWKTEGFYHRFLVHPNGNILAGKYSTEVELDGNTGEIIREFPYQVIFYDISPDGKYISALTDQRCVIDYETEEVVERFTNSNTSPKFMPDSKTLIFNLEVPFSESYQLASFNLETKQKKISQNYFDKTQIGSPCVSPDGRFVATGGWYYKTKDEGDTHLLLWDAQTLEPIRVLGKIEDFNQVRSIKFSPDSKLVGFQVYDEKLYIYNIETFQLYKNYTATGFGFITNDHVALGSGYATPPVFNLVKLDNEHIIYSKNEFAGISEYNQVNNSMIVNHGVIYSFDFEKILTGSSIEPEIPNPFTIEYINNTINIKNYSFVTNSINCSITDINGRVLRNMNLTTSTGGIQIPIKLLSGTYFLHIKDGGKEYVDKFLVVE
jgi:WD40 repeat protein